MLRVDIPSAEVKSKSWEHEGRRGVKRTQVGYVYVGKPFPVEVAVRLAPDQVPYQPGTYIMAPSCFVLERDRLMVEFVELVESPRAK